MNNNPYVVAGTGSKSLQTAPIARKLHAQEEVDSWLTSLQLEHGDDLWVMSGMAEGFDKLLAIRTIFFGINLWCAIPNKGYANYYWKNHSLTGKDQLSAFQAIVANAARVTFVMEEIHDSNSLWIEGRHSNFIRNDFMVEKGHEFLIWDPSSSGTKDCYKSILQTNKPHHILS